MHFGKFKIIKKDYFVIIKAIYMVYTSYYKLLFNK